MKEPDYIAADAVLEVSKEVRGDILLVRFGGGFSLINHLLMARTIQEIKASPQKKVVLDLSDVRYIDSMGVGVIVSVLKHTRTNAIGLAIVTNDVVNQILGVTNLSEILQLFFSLDEALANAAP